MIKLPFRYALSSLYAKLIIDDVFLALQTAAAFNWQQYLIFLDPAMQYTYQQRTRELTMMTPLSNESETVEEKLGLDEETVRLVKEVCIDLKAGEVTVILWNKMNAGYVFRRILLPANWKELLTEQELKAVVGHELGHLKMGADAMVPMRIVNRIGDELLYTLLPIQATGYFLLLMSLISQNPAYLKALSLTFLFRLGYLLIENLFSRKDEYKADRYGKKVSSAEAMITALKKLERGAKTEAFENLGKLPNSKQWYYHWLLKKDTGRFRESMLDHPFLHKRIKALRA
ncbi:hypothetical protein BEP19_16425 [Ammoniphilus oxalaticus]|uniref:Peptidase M48 domain-containing protein n=1 Tax=Ammoniphilus oxalaticus TaxID=66863 RepID=A0A419SQN7_9BACL|nr:M48 family metalloprotease [Ammoniphilus oxalaticus]RKD26783.1 hypothetical protein BEP19_16425 [Ammoniphilus oxalaticus]